MIYKRIINEMSSFSKNHRLLAQYILDNPREVAFMTAAQLARKVGISESTVFRFATHLRFDGYPELRSAIQETIMESLSLAERAKVLISGSKKEEDDIIQKCFELDAQSLLDGASKINRAELYEIAEMIVQANAVYIIGERSSNALAHYLSFYLSWFLPHVHHMPNDYRLEKISVLPRGTLIIGITFRRCITNIVDMLSLAARKGLTTVAITNSKKNALARAASKILTVPCNYISFIDSYTVPISFMNALILATSRRKFGETGLNFADLEKLWEEKGTYVLENLKTYE